MFDSVVMNPPYSANWSADPTFMDDARFNRYGKLHLSPKADFAFPFTWFLPLKNIWYNGDCFCHMSCPI